MARQTSAEKIAQARSEGYEEGRLKGHGEGYQDALANVEAEKAATSEPTIKPGEFIEILLPASEALKETGDLVLNDTHLAALREWALVQYMKDRRVNELVCEIPQDPAAFEGAYVVAERIYSEDGKVYHEFRLYE